LKSLIRFDNIKECIEIILRATENLTILIKEETNKNRQNELSELVYNLAKANQALANFLKEKLPDYQESDEIDMRFNQIIKSLEKNGKS